MRTQILLVGALAMAATASLAAPQFATEGAAKQHCAADAVVWLNIPTHVYHVSGDRWYGKTKSGAFVCQKEADKDSDRASKSAVKMAKP